MLSLYQIIIIPNINKRKKKINATNAAITNKFNIFFFNRFVFSGDGISHSLSWHRKGDLHPGSRLYARVWRPEDPRSILRGNCGSSLLQQHNSSGINFHVVPAGDNDGCGMSGMGTSSGL